VPARRDVLRGLFWALVVTVPVALGVDFDGNAPYPAQVLAGSAFAGLATTFWTRSPRTAWIVGTVALWSGGSQALPLPGFAVALALVLNAGRRDTTRGGIAAMVAQAVPFTVGSALQGDSVAILTFMPEIAWATGRVLRDRDAVLVRLGERARELDEEREAFAQLSVRYERARIAAELHDIVAHAISVMVVQAGAGQRLARTDMAAVAGTFDAIEDAARQAQRDMERLIALLGDEDGTAPAPDLDLVEVLIDRAARNGLDVGLRLEGDTEDLPAAAAETAYRVVQESLTNALRYAAGAHVQVRLEGAEDALLVEVVNGPATADGALTGAGTGNGLRGLRERVGECGGRLEAGPTGDGGWRVSARLPRRVLAVAA
jgi:signal transduction histidine kinase